MIKCIILPLLILVSFASCAHAHPCDSIQSINWVLGQWIADDGKNITLETWIEVSPETYEGLGETHSKESKQLKSSESLRLVEMANEVFYIAKVAHNEHPIGFKLTQCSSQLAVFENPAHDFPKKLEYQLDENQLTVIASDGNEKGFKVSFKKQLNDEDPE
jgi:uncharacterized membrane protein